MLLESKISFLLSECICKDHQETLCHNGYEPQSSFGYTEGETRPVTDKGVLGSTGKAGLGESSPLPSFLPKDTC